MTRKRSFGRAPLPIWQNEALQTIRAGPIEAARPPTVWALTGADSKKAVIASSTKSERISWRPPPALIREGRLPNRTRYSPLADTGRRR